ncbi:hypothetical protein KHS38_18480 [Mucilaginibacter sp. Bleaf8]|uniref:hypothetical protein n=1 Tax=Mucilaginibacter sp. Bleaf8 TaxID=2834430 RepID=UPI001BCFF117|nr:hypothetical protein [Mucilaginibacter sp. Bleaf8]MBS7566402.1 hypothetical protein [Mucilaginibacter sp. Bleaf8]
MKKLLLIISACFWFGAAFAQSGDMAHVRPAVSLGPEVGFVQRSLYNTSYGAIAKLEIPVAATLSATLTGGIDFMHIKSFNFGQVRSTGGTDTYVPVRAGARYFLGPGFYGEGELGAAIQINGNHDKLFAYAIGPGFVTPLKSDGSASALDISFRYESWSRNRMQQVAIRVAYRLGR